MKNRLNRLYNIAPRNPTQTKYNRFRTGPDGKLKSGFTAAVDGYNKAMKEYKTIYEKFLE